MSRDFSVKAELSVKGLLTLLCAFYVCSDLTCIQHSVLLAGEACVERSYPIPV